MSKRELRLEVIENRRMIKWLNNEMENQRIVANSVIKAGAKKIKELKGTHET
jgi:hypothetical protein